MAEGKRQGPLSRMLDPDGPKGRRPAPPTPTARPSSAFCTKCGAELVSVGKFCPNCGAVVMPDSSPRDASLPTYAAAVPTAKKKRNPKPVWIVAGCLAALVVAGIVAAANDAETSSSSSVPASSGGAARTSVPTLARYQADVASITERYSGIFDRIAVLGRTPRFNDPSWTADYSAQMRGLKTVGADVRNLRPPSCLATVNHEFVTAATAYDLAADHGLAGIDQRNVSRLTLANAALEEGNAAIRRATGAAGMARC